MPRLFAFLRAINVGGHVVAMAELRGHFEALDLDDVETFIASGNVIFSSRARNPATLERRIEDRLLKSLGYEVATFVRTGAEVAAIAAYRPFPAAQHAQAATFCVGFLAQPLAPPARKALLALRTDDDDFHVHGSEFYWLSRRRQSESVFSNAVFERTVKGRATFRGMSTMAKLAARYDLAAPTD
jgi:uncharacterized protein (DUF1697 family)